MWYNQDCRDNMIMLLDTLDFRYDIALIYIAWLLQNTIHNVNIIYSKREWIFFYYWWERYYIDIWFNIKDSKRIIENIFIELDNNTDSNIESIFYNNLIK